MKKTREQRRNEAAENMCREIRWQFANYNGAIHDTGRVFQLLQKWMRNAKKNKYKRP